MHGRSLIAVVCSVLVTMAFVATAGAATRYASPVGSGVACSAAIPCTLSTSISGADPFDEIVILPGEYGSAAIPIGVISTSDQLTVRGSSPFEKPLIHLGGATGMTLGYGSTFADIRLRHTGGVTAMYLNGGTISRSELFSSNGYATCPGFSTIVNSVCVNTATDGSAIGSFVGAGGTTALQQVNFRNVTAWASGTNSSGFEASHSGGYRAQFNFHNSIVRGTAQGLKGTTDGVDSSTVALVVNNSNFSGVSLVGAGSSFAGVPGSASQDSMPLLVDPANGDFRPLLGSSTIDAGKNDVVEGAQDFAGSPRIAGAAVDIGAYEYQPPVPPKIPTVPQLIGFKTTPKTFRAAKLGDSFQAASKMPRKKRRQPQIGTLLTFDLNAPASIEISIERLLKGRRSAGKCVKATRKNKRGKSCRYTKAIRGRKSIAGAAGTNSFYFNGRWTPHKLSPGNYRMKAVPTGGSVEQTTFKVVR